MNQASSVARVVFLDRDTMPSEIRLRQFVFLHELQEYGIWLDST
jgi:hypothetical protein